MKSYRVLITIPVLVTAKDECEALAVAKQTIVDHPKAATRGGGVETEVKPA